MKSLKNHLSFLLPLFILLFSFQFSKMVDRSVKEYEKKLTNDYSIVVVSQRVLSINELKKVYSNISSLTHIDKDKYIQKLSNEKISKENLTYLRDSMPEFYKITLKKLPSKDELKLIKTKLLTINGIIKVETYKKSFEKLHQFLLLAKGASFVFTIFIFITSILLIAKQMQIWTYEHQNRMYIMGLFGAPYWLKSAPLYKLVIVDSIIASFIVSVIFVYLPYLANFDGVYKSIGINLDNFHFLLDTFMLLLLSITLSVIAVSVTILKQDLQEIN